MSTWIFRETAPGPGLRVAVKDLIDVAGVPTTAGSLAVADLAGPAAADAACLAGLRAAIARGHACLAGKVNLHELAYGISGINLAFGTPVNPLDPALVPGGSSSGSAVAVATGEADVAYGSDTGGSIRIPAACCGVAGLKTTWGRIPLAGVWPLAPSLDTVGPMARDVAGLAAGMALLEPGFTVSADPPGTVGRVAMDADPAINEAVDAALAATGWQISPVALRGPEGRDERRHDRARRRGVGERRGAGPLRARQDRPRCAGPAARGQRGHPGRSSAWPASRHHTGGRRCRSCGTRFDLLAVPTLLGFPPALDDAQGLARIRGLTSPVNLAGVPALALPVPACGPPASERPADRSRGQRGAPAGRRGRPRAGGPGLTGQQARTRTNSREPASRPGRPGAGIRATGEVSRRGSAAARAAGGDGPRPGGRDAGSASPCR